MVRFVDSELVGQWFESSICKVICFTLRNLGYMRRLHVWVDCPLGELSAGELSVGQIVHGRIFRERIVRGRMPNSPVTGCLHGYAITHLCT